MELKCGKIDRCRHSSDCPHDFRPSGAICWDYDNKRVSRKDYNRESRKEKHMEDKSNNQSSDKPDYFDSIDISRELNLLYAAHLFGSYETYTSARQKLIDLCCEALNNTEDD